MATSTTRAALVCSIDLPGKLGECEPFPAAWLRELAHELAVCEAPVTLALADTAQAAQVRDAATECHELSLRVDVDWAGPEVRRPDFARALKTQLETAQDLGIIIRTLAWGDFPLTPHTDLLVKHGIHAVRTLPAPQRSSLWPRLWGPGSPAATGAEIIRYGLCTAPAVAQWQCGQNMRGLRKPLAEAALNGVAHLACDLRSAPTDRPLDARFRQALRELMRHRHLLKTRLETVADFADRRLTTRKSMPAQSILKVA